MLPIWLFLQVGRDFLRDMPEIDDVGAHLDGRVRRFSVDDGSREPLAPRRVVGRHEQDGIGHTPRSRTGRY